MKKVIVLAMHGMPPKDFPMKEKMEFFKLHSQVEAMRDKMPGLILKRHDDLEMKMRQWPRTSENDPYHFASEELAEFLRKEMECPVYVGFNEFCDPTLDKALEHAAIQAPDKVIIITPMMTRGGEHSEIDIPEAIKRAKEKFPDIDFTYIWPFNTMDIAKFLSEQIRLNL